MRIGGAVGLALLASILLGHAAPASASTHQVSIIQDSVSVIDDPGSTLSTFRALGASVVRVIVDWAQVAPAARSRTAPPGFDGGSAAPNGGASDGADPADYPAANWAPYDEIVKLATAEGMQVDFTVSGGAPRWAEGAGIPGVALDNPFWAWRPSAAAFGQFVHAVGERYSGAYVPPGQTTALPRVSFWGLWNEPNFGEDLGPQAVDGSTVSVAPGMYRSLLDAAWNALQSTGHGGDTILIGGARGPRPERAGDAQPSGRTAGRFRPDQAADIPPHAVLRRLLLPGAPGRGRPRRRVPDDRVRLPPLPGRQSGALQRQRVRRPPIPGQQPAAHHGFVERSEHRAVLAAGEPRTRLDRLQQVYGSGLRLPIYDTEYGYITHPPNVKSYVSPATAAYYINWAEYLSWKQPRVASTMQYLLYDPPRESTNPGDGGFTSGLLFANGRPKPTYAAYRLPLYLPVTSARRGRSLEVWGCVRPAHYTILSSGQPQDAEIQFASRPGGGFASIQAVTVSDPNNCYFDVRVRFPGSGTVRLAYTYPSASPGVGGTTVFSRSVAVTLR